MALTIVFGNTNDNEITSTNAAYATARSGGTLSLGSASGSFISYGQRNFGSGFDCYEGFVEFPYTATATDLKVSAYLQYVQLGVSGTQGRDLLTYENDWGGGTLTTGDWVAGLSVATGAFFSRIIHAEQWLNTKARGGGFPLLTRLSTTGAVRAVNVSNRFQAGTTPSGDEYNKLYSVDQSGTANDPCLIYTTIRRSTLSWVSAASVQLPDGTNVFLESDGAATPAITLKYITAAGGTGTIGTLTVGGTALDISVPSLQKIALVADSSSNIYVIGHKAGTNNDVYARAYKKTGTLTWAVQTALSDSLPAYSNSLGGPNNGVGAWHNTSGSGHIMYVGSHIAYTGHTGQAFYAVLNCTSLLAGTGTLISDSGADPVWLGLATPADFIHYPNETGTLLDVFPIGSSLSGQVHMVDSDGGTTAGRYTLSTSGVTSAGTNSATGLISDAISADKDANGKLRVHILSDGRYIDLNGCRLVARQSAGTLLGFDDLDTSTSGVPTNFPTAAAQKGLSTWDSVLDLASNKVWVYYLDSTDSRILRRTSFSLSTYKGTGESIVVNSTVGATGTTNVSIRAPRGIVDERHVRVAVANVVTSGGALSTVYVDDNFNLAPNAPALAGVPTFDATTSQVFTWTFSDSNPHDTQTARELQIIRTSDSASMVATGKVTTTGNTYTLPASTLSNAVAYQWRVRTWDVTDAQGAFSAFTDFATSGGGSVTITVPATDSPGDQNTADYSITWSVSGTTQASYRVKAIDTADSSTYYDSGFVTSVSTTAVVPNLLSGHVYRIEVTVRNAGLVVSNPGTRLISPVYSAPEAPVVSGTAMDTFIRISVSNPAPVGSEPDVIVNRLFRRPTGTVPWTFLGSIEPNGSYDDYDVGAGVSYDYRVGGEA
jgi:hypothetical protein